MPRAAAILLLGAVIAWGLRITILEGFVYEWPRYFNGDFYAAMYDPVWWDGTGIMYGPVFVVERWLVDRWPHLFTIYLFALADIPAIGLAFVLGAAAARAGRTASLVALAAWLCFRWLYYAFSVAANPEILELLFLSLAWFAASRATPAVAWVAVALATLTKVIPAIFAPLLILRASRRAIIAWIVTGVAVVSAAGIAQRLSPQQLLSAIIVPTQNKGGVSKRQAENIQPIPSMATYVGLNSALARAANLTDHDPSLVRVQTATNVLTFLAYALSGLVVLRLLRGRHALPEVTRVALSYGLFFALMPLMTFNTHPHTFVFLLPAWTAIVATLMEDNHRRRTTIFGVLFLLVYVFAGVPTVAVPLDRLLGTRFALSTPFADPIWADLALILSLSAYAVLRTRDVPAPPANHSPNDPGRSEDRRGLEKADGIQRSEAGAPEAISSWSPATACQYPTA